MDDQFQVLINAVLDSKSIGSADIAKIQKALEKYTINLSTQIDEAQVVAEIKKVVPELQKYLKDKFDIDIEINDDDLLKAYKQIQAESIKAAKAQDSLTESMARGREKSEQLRKSEEKRQQLAQNNAVNKNLEQEYLQRKKIEEINKSQSNKIQEKIGIGDYEVQIAKIENSFSKLNISAEESKNKISSLSAAYAQLQNAKTDDERVKAEKNFQIELAKTKNELTKFQISQSGVLKPITDLQRMNLSNKMQKWLSDNTAVGKKLESQIQDLIQKCATLDGQDFYELETAFKRLQMQAEKSGHLGKSWSDTFKSGVQKFSEWGIASGMVMGIVQRTKDAFAELKNIDTILTEISKTSERTVSELKNLGDVSFETASKYGKKASDFLYGVQEMSRAGYNNSEQMAELSTLAQSAGDMTSELSIDYLIASDAAYGYAGNIEKLNALLDGQNQVTNRNAVSMDELANATKIAANQLSNMGIEENELTALLGTGIATSREAGETVGRAVKGIMMNLQQVKGETGFDGEIIDEESLKKVETRCHSVGVELEYMKDGIARLRDPMEVLKELSNVYNSLPTDSAERAGIIADIGGKYRGNILSSILSNWDKVEKMLADYENSTGSAMEEAMKSANNWEGSLNRLSNTWTDTVENLADSDMITGTINGLNGILEIVNKLTSALGGLGTAGLIGGGILSAKGLGLT